MTTSVKRQCFATQHQTCKTKTNIKTDFVGLRLVLSYDRRSQTTSLARSRGEDGGMPLYGQVSAAATNANSVKN